MHCVNHPSITANYLCEWCGAALCTDCVVATNLTTQTVFSCRCGGRAISVVSDVPSSEPAGVHFVPPDDTKLSDCWSYALRGNGLWILGTTALFLFVSKLVLLPIWIFYYSYMLAYGKKMVLFSADGDRDMPDWPDYTNLFDDIVTPLFQYIFCLLICFGPTCFFLYSSYSSLFLAIPLAVLGSLYLPICLLSVSMHDSALAGLNFHKLIPLIWEIGVDYLFAVLLMFGSFAVVNLLPPVLGDIPLVGTVIIDLVAFYLFITTANLLGLLYFKHKLDFF